MVMGPCGVAASRDKGSSSRANSGLRIVIVYSSYSGKQDQAFFLTVELHTHPFKSTAGAINMDHIRRFGMVDVG
jgi:hypothetical protein